MKGVILAGGKGTRLRPITKIINKNLLPVGSQPVIYYPIMTLKNSGIKDILVICGPEYAEQYVKLLGSGRGLGVNLSYTLQPKPIGLAHGLGLARGFAEGQKVAFILGDNIFGDDFRNAVLEFKKRKNGATIVLKKVADPGRFGVVEFDKKNKGIKKIIEKPKIPPTNWVVTGFYLYDNNVFDVIRTLKPSKRGEYEITDVNNCYINEGKMEFIKAKKFWIDAGTFEALHKANVIFNKRNNLPQV